MLKSATVKPKIFHIGGVGPVPFIRSRRARRIVVTVKPPGIVTVSVPYGVSYDSAARFTVSKADWINRQLSKLARQQTEDRRQFISEEGIDRQQAGKVLGERLRQLADKYGYSFNRITIRNQRTRWGSCSANNDISLNMKLVKLPAELRDYVLIHELVHTHHKNHGKRFWAEMDRNLGEAKKISTRLRKYRLRVV